MNSLHLNETTLDLFEQYTRKELNEHELAEFNTKLDQDADFSSSYQAFLISQAVINEKIEASLKEKLKEWNKNTIATEKIDPGKIIEMPAIESKVRKIQWSTWAAAASILLLLIAGLNYKSNKEYADHAIYAYLPLESGETRGVPSSGINLTQILKDLGDKPIKEKMEIAIQALNKALPTDENYKLSQRLLGNLYASTGNCELAQKSYSIYGASKDDIDFLNVVCLLKSNSNSPEFKQKLNEMLQNRNSAHYKELQEIKSKTTGFWWTLFN